MNQHKFQIGNFHVTFDDITALAILGLTKLRTHTTDVAMKAAATEFIRAHTNTSSFDAKQIMEFIAENGCVDECGRFYVQHPRAAVIYSAHPL